MLIGTEIQPIYGRINFLNNVNVKIIIDLLSKLSPVSNLPKLLTEQSFKVLAVSKTSKLLTELLFYRSPMSEKPKLLTNYLFKVPSERKSGKLLTNY